MAIKGSSSDSNNKHDFEVEITCKTKNQAAALEMIIQKIDSNTMSQSTKRGNSYVLHTILGHKRSYNTIKKKLNRDVVKREIKSRAIKKGISEKDFSVDVSICSYDDVAL